MTKTTVEVVVDGTDGAGKTSLVHFLVAELRKRGLSVSHHAPYKEQEVYPLWHSDPWRAAETIVGIMDRCRAANQTKDVIVWDRGWPTAFVSTHDERARALFHPLPPVTILLLGTMEHTAEKTRRHNLRGVWLTDQARVRKYNAAYRELEVDTRGVVLRFIAEESKDHNSHLPKGARMRFEFEEILRALGPVLESSLPRC